MAQPSRFWIPQVLFAAGVAGIASAIVLHFVAGRAPARLPLPRPAAHEPLGPTPLLIRVQGDRPAPARPALGLALDGTTFEEASRWAASRHLSCEPRTRGLRFLQCLKVPAPAIGEPADARPVTDLTLTFAPDGKLVGVDALRTGLSPSEAHALMTTVAARLAQKLGPPARQKGDPTAAYLAQGSMRGASVEYRFAGYRAEVIAMHLPVSGVSLREQYRSAEIAQSGAP